MLEDQAKAEGDGAAAEEKKEEVKKEEPPPEDGEGDDKGSRASARDLDAQVKKKRPAVDKQTAYLEFKDGSGKQIEESILLNR
jgi:hypothetical protein